jgi:formyltetrahydrofolate-dependent phosphoribosylglycinamide formyltransferase
MPKRIAVMVSGRGSNLEALYKYFHNDPARREQVEIALVASDNPRAGALAFARRSGIPAAELGPANAHADTLAALLREHAIDLVVLAGYLRLVPAPIVHAFRGRIINVHPALLPAFGGKGMYGERVHRAVLESGAGVSGATVHFVDEVYDRGATIAQWPVPVFGDDTVASLAARVLRIEHLLLPRAVAAVAREQIRFTDDGRAAGARGRAFHNAAFALGVQEEDELAHDISAALAE